LNEVEGHGVLRVEELIEVNVLPELRRIGRVDQVSRCFNVSLDEKVADKLCVDCPFAVNKAFICQE